jgi:8-oxo-dGTP pyrophosphatase MutT (NUDIX family)
MWTARNLSQNAALGATENYHNATDGVSLAAAAAPPGQRLPWRPMASPESLELTRWPCLQLARWQGPRRRWPVLVDGVQVGSVAEADLPALRDWPQVLQVGATPADGVRLIASAEARNAALAVINAALHEQGLIRGWRAEPYALLDADGRRCGVIERAAAKFWGSLSFGAHCNGYVAIQGRPQALWIAQRAMNKPTDPGRFDNLIGGGVPLGQTPHQALCREAWEEAGLQPEALPGLVAGSVIELDCDVPEGRQHEWLHVFDLALPADWQPSNQDGEVQGFRLLPVDQALELAAGGEMTTDAALCTLDFALRHGLLPGGGYDALQTAPEALAALRVDPRRASRWSLAAAAA